MAIHIDSMEKETVGPVILLAVFSHSHPHTDVGAIRFLQETIFV